MILPENSIPALISAYNDECRLTGTPGAARAVIYERQVYDFLQAQFTQDDLLTVVKFIRLKQRKDPDCKYVLRLGTLLTDLVRFSDLLALATAMKPKQRTPAQQVVHEFRRHTPEDKKNCFRQVGDIIKQQTQTL